MEKNQEAFAELIHVERSTISVWEKKDLKATSMDAQTETFIRLKMATYVGVRITRLLLEEQIELAISQEESGEPIQYKAA